LAHAFYPGSLRGGDAHFDVEEDWNLDDRYIDEYTKTSLKNVAIHEFGHSLGIGHSNVQGAVMFPWYSGYRGDGDLPEDDKLAIQSLYGTRDGQKQWGPNNNNPTTTTTRRTPYTQPAVRTTTTRRTTVPTRRHHSHHHTPPRRNDYYPTTQVYYPDRTTATPPTRRTHHYNPHSPHNPRNDKPDTCNTAYDAITMIRGEVFVFKGRYLWRIGGQSNGIPYEIRSMWKQLPESLTHVDTVYENKRGQIVFFVGELLCCVNKLVLDFQLR
jgi:hypothetical protein